MKLQKPDSSFYLLVKRYCIAVLLAGTAILFYACEDNELAKVKPIQTIENFPVMEASNFETLITDSGQVRYSLKAPKLLRFENDRKTYSEFPEGIILIKYDANKKIISSITANYAKQFDNEERWEAKNNVIVTNENGDTLKTEHLLLDEKTQKIETEEYVKIITKDKITNGIGLTSDLDMKNAKIWDVNGIYYLPANNSATRPTSSLNDTLKASEVEIPQQDSNRVLQFK